MKLKKNLPVIDQHDKNGFWGGKFGGSFVPETLKKPIDDLSKLFSNGSDLNNFVIFLFINYLYLNIHYFVKVTLLNLFSIINTNLTFIKGKNERTKKILSFRK